MSEFDVLVDQLRATWAGARDEPTVLDASLEHEIAEFKAHRSRIEQAKGVLMQLLSVDADTAFAVLRRYSQENNIKVRELADRLAEAAAHRETPSRDGHDPAAVNKLLERLSDHP